MSMEPDRLVEHMYRETAIISLDPVVKGRLDAFLQNARTSEEIEGEPNGLTTYSGAVDYLLDMELERDDDEIKV